MPTANQRVPLATFIQNNREPILAEWESFARTCMPASKVMDVRALRDHAVMMLDVIAADLRQPQTTRQRAEKSRGHAPARTPGSRATAAEEHGAGRARSGFTMVQMVAEYRALRASVVRLWTSTFDQISGTDLEDLTRFNEAVDQSLAESVARFTDDIDKAKETFLAILGHDLRTPLGAIRTSATFMLETGELPEPHCTLAARIATSAGRAVGMVGDLLDFTRAHLDGGIPVERADANLGKIVHDVADEVCAANPTRKIRLDARGELHGRWDSARLAQAIGNLVGNAVQHGAAGTTITITVGGDDNNATVAVHNRGTVIDADQLDAIFNPLRARTIPRNTSPTASLGLGLYIAERIVSAHGGRIQVASSEEHGTTFTIMLPRA